MRPYLWIVAAVALLLAGCSTRAAKQPTGKPALVMTDEEYAEYTSIRERIEAAQFGVQKATLDANALIEKICRDRAIEPAACGINPATRIITQQKAQPQAPPPAAAPK